MIIILKNTTMNNLYPIKTISKEEKEKFLNTKAKIIWLTGLSGSGKSTIAIQLEKIFLQNNLISTILDGDNLRLTINSDLGFSLPDRYENVRRVAEISKMFLNCGVITIVSLITPTNILRKLAKDIIGEEDFIEVYVKASIETCIKRDPKGIYKKDIDNFTGKSSIFETLSIPIL